MFTISLSFLCRQADAASFNTMLTLCGSNIDEHWMDAKEVFELAMKYNKV